MNWQEVVLGIVLFLIFWAFQAGYLDVLGTAGWFVGAIIFVGILWAIGRSKMQKPQQDVKATWNFAVVLALVVTFLISIVGSWATDLVPAGLSSAQVGSMTMGFWLIVFGGAMFVTGWVTKMGVASVIGILWLFSSLYFTLTGAGTYVQFGMVTALPFIIGGILTKK